MFNIQFKRQSFFSRIFWRIFTKLYFCFSVTLKFPRYPKCVNISCYTVLWPILGREFEGTDLSRSSQILMTSQNINTDSSDVTNYQHRFWLHHMFPVNETHRPSWELVLLDHLWYDHLFYFDWVVEDTSCYLYTSQRVMSALMISCSRVSQAYMSVQ